MIRFGALEAGGTKMVLSLMSEEGEMLERVSMPTLTPAETMPKMIAFFKERNISALGIGCFGPVDLNPASGGLCSLAQGLCLRQRVAGRRDVAADQIGRIFGLNVPQDEDGQRLPGLPQLQRLGQAADGQPGRALLGKHAGALHGPVAVAVGLDHGAQGQCPGAGLDGAEIVPQGIQVDLGPDVFFKGC